MGLQKHKWQRLKTQMAKGKIKTQMAVKQKMSATIPNISK